MKLIQAIYKAPKRLTPIICAACLQACAVIHFENGPVVPDPSPDIGFDWTLGLLSDSDAMPDLQYDAASSIRYRRWYHHAIFSLAEISNPLQLKVDCSGLEWNQITTEVTPTDFIFGLTDNILLYNANSWALDLWSPWSIEYSCRDRRR
ncbi:hypothetical protein A3758_21355 [Oleiphilus sp. HI0118]|jgi:hypothetical protein|nr:hypothetical protein A3758_07765 [Oleiphilus sp. HI0118]KZZ42601.1 hypothetical protein A3758_21355 [Oleiphilus sp. HI0118]